MVESRPMSVHTQTDKFPSQSQPPTKTTAKDTKLLPSSSSDKNSTTTLDQGLLALLGPNVTSFPYGEEAYIESIKLRSQQEITKQQFYRIELANKNLSIIQLAVKANIPAHLIAQMCVSPDGSLKEIENHISSVMAKSPELPSKPLLPSKTMQSGPPSFGMNTLTPRPSISSMDQVLPSHSYSQSIPSTASSSLVSENLRKRNNTGLLYQDSLNTSPIPPISYRFGSGSSKRPLLPAKIGAQAVANLASPTTPYRQPTSNARRSRLVPSHQRTYSMPAEIELARQPQLHSPMGGTSSIQVKPSPAQPLSKANKNPPSQESMTSFQHIIQFHHWKPEMGPTIGSSNTIFKNHKRHKSTSEAHTPASTPRSTIEDTTSPGPTPELNIPSVTVVDTSNIKADDTMDDVSVDDTEMDESKIVPDDTDANKSILETKDTNTDSSSKLHNVGRGRYPHDILSG